MNDNMYSQICLSRPVSRDYMVRVFGDAKVQKIENDPIYYASLDIEERSTASTVHDAIELRIMCSLVIRYAKSLL